MADWVNTGSYQDLSSILPVDPVSALTPTSQGAGNMLASNENAMTAPGSPPVDNMNSHLSQVTEDPAITPSNKVTIEPADDGKPQASSQASDPSLPAPGWKYRKPPGLVRKPVT